MGAALRAARDDEEAAWAEALRRGIAFEVAKNGLDHEAARKAAIRNLAADLNHYDSHRDDASGPTPTEAEPSAAVDRPRITPRGADPANTYEVARSAIRALGLPPSKYASYLRQAEAAITDGKSYEPCLLYTSPSPRDRTRSRMPSSA